MALLQLGYSVLISDVDALVISDPSPFFESKEWKGKADLWVSSDCLSPSQDRCAI